MVHDAIPMLSKYGINCTSWKSVVFTNTVGKNSQYFLSVFNKTIIPLALVGYEMIISRAHIHCACTSKGNAVSFCARWWTVKKSTLQPRTQVFSRCPSDQSRLGTKRDRRIFPRIFPTSLTGDVTSEISEDDWERGCLPLYNSKC